MSQANFVTEEEKNKSAGIQFESLAENIKNIWVQQT
jgi:hypothetical protein